MAHAEQVTFCKHVKKQHPIFFSRRLVLDIGSLDINGSNRYLFEECKYIGVDLKLGKNVDFASKGHDFLMPDESMDVVISTECFEHDKFYRHTINNIVRMLSPGGLFIFTCATTGRPEHGTRKTSPQDAPFLEDFDEWADYYKNLEESDVRAVVDVDKIFSSYEFSVNESSCDLYFWGIKHGELPDRELDEVFEEARQAKLEFQTRISGLETRLTAMQAALVALEHQKIEAEERGLEFERQLSSSREQEKEAQALVVAMKKSLFWRLGSPIRMFGRLLK